MARLHAAKGDALRRKQTVNWKTVERDWDEYFEQFAGDEWRDEFMPVIEGVIADQGERWNAALGMQFDVREVFAETWFETYMAEFAQPILETTKTDISLLLKQAMENGWGIDEMSKQLDLTWDRYLTEGVTAEGRGLTDEEIQWFLDRKPRYRRDMLARTETIRASNAGSQALFQAWGVVEEHEWLASLDDRVRPSHAQANGQVRPLNEPFVVGGYRMMYPGDASLEAPASEFVNCRCVVLPVVATEAD